MTLKEKNLSKTGPEKLKDFQRFGSVLGLERMKKLLFKLGNPEKKLKVIHVAGTNGKGSICHYLYNALLENRYKAGMFISPYLERFNERIQLGGEYISDEDLDALTDRVVKATEIMVEEGEDSPTEFEVITAIALLYFKEKEADVVILEVGLGGRGDSTNVIEKPIMSIIGSISYDHMDRLGNTIEEIAMEKAGIIKRGCPLVTAIEDKVAFNVVASVAEEKSVPFIDGSAAAGRATISESTINGMKYSVRILGDEYHVETSMAGEFQLLNSVTALVALEYMREKSILRLNKDDILKGIKKAFNPGRLEILSHSPLVILDGAHNQDSSKVLRNAALNAFGEDLLKECILITAMMSDKEIDKIMENLLHLGGKYFLCEPENPRRADGEVLAASLANLEVDPNHITIIRSPREAVSKAFEEISMGRAGGVVIAGSLYLVGEVRSQVIEEVRHLEMQADFNANQN